MKKLLLISLLCFTFLPMFAQNNEELNNQDKFIYCEIVGTQRFMSNKVTVELDYGQAKRFGDKQRLRGEDGKPVIFNSMVDAMNWMGSKGWEFCQAYVVTYQSQNVYHWLLKLNSSKLTKEDIDEIMSDFNTTKK